MYPRTPARLHWRSTNVSHITPILNVSDLVQSFAWFERFGWKKLWDWNSPATFGAVGSGTEAVIFLCQNAQGGRGKGGNTTTFTGYDDDQADRGVWMSLWIDNVDEIAARCSAAGLDITFGPENMPWGARELHVRHPDGHVFRVSQHIRG